MADDAVVLLILAGQEAGNVDQRHHRDVEGIAEPDESGCLPARVDIETACLLHRLIGDDADGRAVHPGHTGDDVGGEVGLKLKEFAVVDDLVDDFLHVIGLGGILGHQAVQRVDIPARVIDGFQLRRAVAVAQRQKAEEPAQIEQRVDVVFEGGIGHTADPGVGGGAAQFFLSDVFMGDGLHNVRTGDKHVRRIAHHEDKVGDRGRIDRPTCAGAHDHRDLRNHTAGQHVLLEHVRVAAEAGHTLLNAGTAAVRQPDHWGANPHGLLHHLADFLGVGFGQGAAEDREILAVDKRPAAVDQAGTGHHPVPGDAPVFHTEVGGAVLDEHVELFEGVGVEQNVEALSRGQLAALVLGVDAVLSAAQTGAFATARKFGYVVGHGLVLPGPVLPVCLRSFCRGAAVSPGG